MLRLIGLFFSVDNYNLPDPSFFVDHDWIITERNKVLRHLKQGHEVISSDVMSWDFCRFRCQDIDGISEFIMFSDGIYVWPKSYIHHVEKHFVKPPLEFINHVLDYNYPSSINIEEKVYDLEWWKRQKYHSDRTSKSYIDSHLNFYLLRCYKCDERAMKMINEIINENYIFLHNLIAKENYSDLILKASSKKKHYINFVLDEAKVRGLKLDLIKEF